MASPAGPVVAGAAVILISISTVPQILTRMFTAAAGRVANKSGSIIEIIEGLPTGIGIPVSASANLPTGRLRGDVKLEDMATVAEQAGRREIP